MNDKLTTGMQLNKAEYNRKSRIEQNVQSYFWRSSAHLAEAVAQSFHTLFVFGLVVGCSYFAIFGSRFGSRLKRGAFFGPPRRKTPQQQRCAGFYYGDFFRIGDKSDTKFRSFATDIRVSDDTKSDFCKSLLYAGFSE